MLSIMGIKMSVDDYIKVNNIIVKNVGRSWNKLSEETRINFIKDILE